MKSSVLFLSVLGCTLAVPNGYYHQENHYKTSSSSYRNNELQHQTDDQGYYIKDGDLAGKFKPRVDANSEHSEYVNPNIKSGQYHTGFVGGANGDMSSYGNLRAENTFGAGDYGTHGIASEGLAQSDNIVGRRFSAGSYGGYGSSSNSYGMSSNLRSITERLQSDLQRDLQEAIQENRAYSQSNRVGISELERELRQNLTDKLNAELMSKYGQQSIRGGLSYTISGGQLHSTANYDNQELADLRRQLENSLLNQLRTQYQRYDNSAVSRYETHGIQNNYGYSTTTLRPYYYIQPVETVRPFTRPIYPNLERIHYTPTANPESITTIATRVQNQLDSRLNQILQETQRRYFSSNSAYSLTNADVVLERLRNELKSNLTYLLDEDIRRNYGSQTERDGHLYSVGPGGETSSQYNYSIRDLENLRSQIERNLLDKLNRDFENFRSRWSQQSRQSYSESQYGSSNTNYQYNTPRYEVYSPRYEVYSTPRYNTYDSDVEHLSTRPTSAHITPLITSGGSNSNQQYKYLAGTKTSGYEISGSGTSISQLQRQLQQDLSRQLQAAISRGQYGSYSTSGSYNPSSYQVSLQQLSDELNRNLTRQLQEYSSGSYYSTYGNVNQEQLANLRNQLQTDLMRQLQQGLQQQYYSSSSSYSASSSSSSSNNNYRPVRGSQNYQLGQYRTGGNIATFEGEDCVGDDPNSYTGHRIKRSQPYRSQPIGLSSSSYYRGYGNAYNSQYSYNSHPRHYPQQIVEHPDDDAELNQHITDPDLTQQVEDQDYQKIELGQQTDDSDLTQQVENSPFGILHTGSQKQQIELGQQVEDQDFQKIELGQQTDDSDLTQQVENSPFGKLHTGSQKQKIELGQEIIDSDLTQQVQSPQYQQLQTGPHYTQQNKLSQQLENFDLTQQEVNSGKLQQAQIQHTSQQVQDVDNADLTQQAENSQYEQLQTGPHYIQQNELGQQLEDFNLSHQHNNLGKLQLGSQSQQKPQIAQGVDNSDLTQQVQNSEYEQLQTRPQYGQQNELNQNLENLDLTQQSDVNFGKLQLGSQNQQQFELGQELDNSDLTQQVEDNNFGSQNQRQIETGQEIQEHTNIPPQETNPYTIPQRGYSQFQIRPIRPITPNQNIIGYSDLNQQVEDSRYRDFQSGSQQSHALIGYGGQDNFDLTQQVQTSGLGKLQVGSQQQVDVESPDTTQQVEENVPGKLQFGSQHPQTHFNQEGFLSQQRQIQIADELRNNLLDQIKSAVKNSYSFVDTSDVTQTKLIYNKLNNELQQNITRQLYQDRPNGSSYASYFSNQDLKNLRKQLENKLKLNLHQEIYNYTIRQIPDKNYVSQQTGQLVDDHDLTQQVEEVDSNLTQQQEVQNADVSQQNEENPFKPIVNENQVQTDYTTINQNANVNSQSQLQFGSQQIQQQPDEQTQDLTQQVEDDDFGKYQFGQQEIEQQPTQHQHFPQYNNEDHFQTNSEKININEQTDNNHFRQTQIPSANLQLGNRPVTRKPVNSNNFLQTEINHQQNDLLDSQQYRLHQQQIDVNQHPNNLPTLNQVIQQQHLQNINNEEYNREIPSVVEPLSIPKNDGLSQQVDLDQQQTDLTDENPTTIIPQRSSDIETVQPNAGQSIIVTNQGQFINQPQTRTEAENQADLLIQKLRSLQNRPNQSPNEENLNQPLSNSQTNSQVVLNTDQHGSFDNTNSNDQQQSNLDDLQFNQQQLQFAKQLENELSKQLQDCISNNYNTYSDNLQQPYQVTYQQLSQELQRNITKKIRENSRLYGTSYSSYSTYGTLNSEQRETLLNQLQKDLLKQLQQNLRTTYAFQQTNTQHSSYGYSRGYSSYGHSQINEPKIHYGQQNELGENIDDISDIHPVQPQQANVVQSVEPLSNYNTGVKGQNDYGRNASPLSPNVINSESAQTSNLESQPTQVQNLKQDEVSPTEIPVENLPWWKRFGSKIKHGASSLKEKIIG